MAWRASFSARLQAGHAGRIPQHVIGQHGAGGDGKALRGVRRLAQLCRLLIIAPGIDGENFLRRGGLRQGWRQQQQREERSLHFKNSPWSAARIIAAVFAVPNSAAKEPKRGPAVWPSSTS